MIAQADIATGAKQLHRVLHFTGKYPLVFQRLRSDLPAGLKALGVHVDTQLIKAIAGIPGATDEELLEAARVRTAAIAQDDPGSAVTQVRRALDLADKDSLLFQRLCADPLREFEDLGVRIDTRLIKEIVGIPCAASDEDLLDVLLGRTAAYHASCCN